LSTGAVNAGSCVERDALVDRLPEPLRRVVLSCTDVTSRERPPDARRVRVMFDRAMDEIQPRPHP